MKYTFGALLGLLIFVTSVGAQTLTQSPMIPNGGPSSGGSSSSLTSNPQSANYTTQASDCSTYIPVTTVSNNLTIILGPATVAGANCIQTVQKFDQGFGSVTVSDGSFVRAVEFTQNDIVQFISDGAAWQHYKHTISPVTYVFNAGGINTLGAVVGGSAYTDGTYTAVPLTGSVSGVGGTATVVISGGAVTTVTPGLPGNKFRPGETLSANPANIGGTGSGFSVPIASILTTFTAPPLAASISAKVIGAGAGAGSGGESASGVAHTGGNPGGGGEIACGSWPANVVGSTQNIVIPAGGVGGLSVTGSTIPGNAGTAPTLPTSFGFMLQVIATNGVLNQAGAGGTASGTSPTATVSFAGAVANCGREGLANQAGTSNVPAQLGGATGTGAAGGSDTTVPSATSPATGTIGSAMSNPSTAGGIAGTVSVINAGNGANIAAWAPSIGCVANSVFGDASCASGAVPAILATYTTQDGGSGGGGGYAPLAANGGAGGNGGCPGGGGGGGGASDNTFTSGKGGRGCHGDVRVTVGF